MPSFEFVTGPKNDKWLVKTISWLFVVIALHLWFIHDPKDGLIVGIGSALVIGGVEVYYSMRNRIPRIYLLDALPQVLFIFWWLIVLARM